MLPNIRSLNTFRARSYVLRLPLFTRLIVIIIITLWAVGLQTVWDLRKFGALVPSEVTIWSAHRLSTYPLVHLNIFHAILNVLTLTPLLERFEYEHGTLTTLLLFFGPLTTFPGFLYLVIEMFILRSDNAVMGASMWVFLLLGMEAIKTFKTNPYLVIGTYHIPTWTTPLLLVLVVAAVMPSTSLLGHLCGVAIGYLAGLGYVKYLAPPEKGLRWAESKFNLLAILPHYVSVDQKTYGRFGVLPTANRPSGSAATELVGSTQRLGP